MSALRALLRRLRQDRRGTAMVEFAVAAPVVLTVGVVGLEMANFGIANLRVTQLAAIAADSASRVRDSIDEADVVELLAGAKMTGEKIQFAQNGRIVLSSLEQNDPNGDGNYADSNGQWIRWQRCDGARRFIPTHVQDKGKTNNSLQAMGPAGNQIAALPGTAVNVVEVEYVYQPVAGSVVFQTPRIIRTTVAFNVRQRTSQALTNSSNLSAAQIRTCDKFQA